MVESWIVGLLASALIIVIILAIVFVIILLRKIDEKDGVIRNERYSNTRLGEINKNLSNRNENLQDLLKFKENLVPELQLLLKGKKEK